MYTDRSTKSFAKEVVGTAHSMACLLVAHWATVSTLLVHSALLVAVPDPDGPAFPIGTVGFSPLPHKCLPFRSIVVASTNDPFGSVEFNKRCAANWGSKLVNIGAEGHINADSNLGNWPQGFNILQNFD